MRAAIASLGVFTSARMLEAPCGIGNHAVWIAEDEQDVYVMGLNIGEKQIAHVRSLVADKPLADRVTFVQDDVTQPKLPDDSFDVVWCCGGVWLGPPETGCFAEELYGVLSEF